MIVVVLAFNPSPALVTACAGLVLATITVGSSQLAAHGDARRLQR